MSAFRLGRCVRMWLGILRLLVQLLRPPWGLSALCYGGTVYAVVLLYVCYCLCCLTSWLDQSGLNQSVHFKSIADGFLDFSSLFRRLRLQCRLVSFEAWVSLLQSELPH